MSKIADRLLRAMLAALVILAVGGLAPSTSPLAAATAEAAVSCPCSLWPTTATPALRSESDTDAVELGVKFRTSAGTVTAIRFYKGPANPGPHVAHLWSATGWQQVSLAAPVAVAANTTYVASYYAPVGGYAQDEGYFASAARTSGPLTALRSGADGPNGVYRYGASGFPTDSWNSTNYWVDVVFVPNP